MSASTFTAESDNKLNICARPTSGKEQQQNKVLESKNKLKMC